MNVGKSRSKPHQRNFISFDSLKQCTHPRPILKLFKLKRVECSETVDQEIILLTAGSVNSWPCSSARGKALISSSNIWRLRPVAHFRDEDGCSQLPLRKG